MTAAKSSKRTVVLMTLLLLTLAGYIGYQQWREQQNAAASQPQPPLPGSNTVSRVDVRRDERGKWMAQVDYYYTGLPLHTRLRVHALHSGETLDQAEFGGFGPAAVRGKNRATVEIARPAGDGHTVTQSVVVSLMRGSTPLVNLAVDHAIEWPDGQASRLEQEVASQPPEKVLAFAVDLIDSDSRPLLPQAKQRLEWLIARDPKYGAAYIELARVAMKSNWGSEGLHQAENLLGSALQIKPGDVNAQILLGYVYTHQRRYPQAEALFADSAKADPPNLWLWTNWGELLAKRGQVEHAVDKYREAIKRPPPRNTYDRAREDAYRNLLRLLQARKDLDGMDALHRQRVADYGQGSCHGTDYARFLLLTRGEAQRAIDLAKAVGTTACKDRAREVLGMASYVAWSRASGAERDQLLNQARVYVPAGATVMYQLASSERTADAVKKLVESGENVDLTDNGGMNALAYALQFEDIEAARRLLRLGAKPAASVGQANMPVAWLPVMANDLKGIRLMRQFGVDYAKLKFQDTTAIEYAKRAGDRRLMDALDPKAGAT